MADLITLAEYKQYDTTTPSSDDTLLGTLITGASDYIERYTNRTYAQTTYDEVYDGQGYRTILLDHFPVISIARVATAPSNVLTIRNTSSSVSRATVSVTSSGLTLTSVASAVTTTTSLTFASYPTLASLATAIGAMSGWTASAASGYETWASADLRAVQGAISAKGQDAWLIIHTTEIAGQMTVNEAAGELEYQYRFSRGVKNWRVVYTANFATTPTAIKVACMELVKCVYSARRLDPNLQSQSLGIWSWTRGIGQLSKVSQESLTMYRAYRVPRFRTEGTLWR